MKHLTVFCPEPLKDAANEMLAAFGGPAERGTFQTPAAFDENDVLFHIAKGALFYNIEDALEAGLKEQSWEFDAGLAQSAVDVVVVYQGPEDFSAPNSEEISIIFGDVNESGLTPIVFDDGVEPEEPPSD